MRRSFVHASAAVTLVITACVSGAGVLAGGGANPPAGAPAVRFAPGIVSTGDVFASTFTPDGKTVVFTKFSPPKPMALMISEWRDHQWTAPRPLPFSGRYRDLDPSFSADGRRLYFSSLRPVGPSPGDTASGVDTWYVDRDGDQWGAHVRLAEPVNGNEVDMYPSVTRRGVVYFDSRRSRNQRLVYRAEPRADGSFAEPQLLDATINADSGASNLFVDPDERYVVFGAVRPEGRGGMDLYLSMRTASGWSTPRNLGPLVNTDATEFCPFVSSDGRFLYFTRISPLGNGQVERNIYVVRFDAIRTELGDGVERL
jgi:Tol biopolymer transport system component